MAYHTGIILAAVLCGAAWLVRFDRERVFYPTMLIVVASYYVLFAALGGDNASLLLESVLATAFLGLAVAGFWTSLWLVVLALAGHGIVDLLHPLFLPNDGVPAGWPAFCFTFDLVAALFLGVLLIKRADVAFHLPGTCKTAWVFMGKSAPDKNADE